MKKKEGREKNVERVQPGGGSVRRIKSLRRGKGGKRSRRGTGIKKCAPSCIGTAATLRRRIKITGVRRIRYERLATR